MPKKLFVGNLSYDTNDASLTAAFEQAKISVARVQVMLDRETGRPRGFAFVELAEGAEVSAAIEAMNGASVDGRPIRVDEATERAPRDRSGGPPRGRSGPPRERSGPPRDREGGGYSGRGDADQDRPKFTGRGPDPGRRNDRKRDDDRRGGGRGRRHDEGEDRGGSGGGRGSRRGRGGGGGQYDDWD